MKSCVKWRKSFKYLDEIDEFDIDFRNKKEQLLKFLDIYAISQRVNIHVPIDITATEVKILLAIWEKEKYKIAIVFDWINEEDNEVVFKLVQKAGVPFYFSYLIDTWDKLYDYFSLGVSDVYITSELGFDLKRVHALCQEKRVQLRCYPNVCQSNSGNSNGLKSFFIRPEDIDYYSPYIDVLEFFDSEDKQNALYDIYFHIKEWDGNLQEIIKGLKIPINSYYLLGKYFAEYRIECQKDCIKGGSCKICDVVLDLAESIEKSQDYEVFKKEVE